MLKRIRRTYRESKQPFNALWKWATGSWKRWRALTRWSKKNAVKGRKKRVARERRLKERRKRLREHRQEARKIHGKLEEINRQIAEEEASREPDHARLARLERRRKEARIELNALRERIDRDLDRIEVLERRVEDAKEVLRFWWQKRTIYRKQWRKARREARKTGKPKFEPWMLHGLPANLSEPMKEVVAYVVVEESQTITATSNGVHSPTSYHYYTPIRAIDWAGANMCAVQTRVYERFRSKGFRELFGPCAWYIKNNGRYGGMFPAHGDHGHTVLDF